MLRWSKASPPNAAAANAKGIAANGMAVALGQVVPAILASSGVSGVKPGKQLLTSFKRFVRFLIGTGRIDYATGEDLSDFLKQVSKAT